MFVFENFARTGGFLGQFLPYFRLTLTERLARLVPSALVADIEVQSTTLLVRLDEVASEMANSGDDGLRYFELIEFGRSRIELLRWQQNKTLEW